MMKPKPSLERSRHPNGPTGYYVLAFFFHVTAFFAVLVATFLPQWTTVREKLGLLEISYERGVVVSCDVPGSGSSDCGFNTDIPGQSTEFVVCFVLLIVSLLLGFFILQELILGACVRSLKEKNLGLILALQCALLSILLILCLVFFQVSVPNDVTTGNVYEDHSFGIARIIIAVAIVLEFLVAFFASGEYFKRKEYKEASEDYTVQKGRLSSIRGTPSTAVHPVATTTNNATTTRKASTTGIHNTDTNTSSKNNNVINSPSPSPNNNNNNTNNNNNNNNNNSIKNRSSPGHPNDNEGSVMAHVNSKAKKFSLKENRISPPFSNDGYKSSQSIIRRMSGNYRGGPLDF